jgi:hypothetical protein|nr:MAG TPA: hypothetical protein [Caudoviricetes sp.]
MKKFSEWVEKYESENNGRVIFTVIDNVNNVMGEYEEEEYNRGDEESVNTYKTYCNADCRLISVAYNMMWVKVVCEVI